MTLRNRIRTSSRSVFHHDPNLATRHHGRHSFADPHTRSQQELELIAGHHRDAA